MKDPRETIAEAKAYYQSISELPIDEALRPSQLWRDHIRDVLKPAMDFSDVTDIVHYVQDYNGFSYPRQNTDREFSRMIRGYTRWLLG